MRRVVCVYGVPSKLVLDEAPSFVSELLGTVCEGLGTQRYLITAYNSAANGRAERQIAFVKNKLRTMLRLYKGNWPNWLPLISFAYSTAILSGGEFSPHFLMFGKNARLHMDAALGTSNELTSPRLSPESFSRHMIDLWAQWGARQLEIGSAAAERYNRKQLQHPKSFAVKELFYLFDPQSRAVLSSYKNTK